MKKQNILSRISRHLILQSNFIKNLGLLNGKMGIALFFFHYAACTGNSVYEDFAGELIDEIINGVHQDYPLDFKNGICGVGWGLEYLSQNGFVKLSADTLLDYDKGIVEKEIANVKDYSISTGLKGVIHYVISRYNNGQLFAPDGFITKEYVAELLTVYCRKENPDREDRYLCVQMESMLQDREISVDMKALLRSFICPPVYAVDNLFDIGLPLGMSSGYAGIGLNVMLNQQEG